MPRWRSTGLIYEPVGMYYGIWDYKKEGRIRLETEYYVEHFGEICEKSQRASEVVRDINAKNGYIIKMGCNSNVEVSGEDASKPKLMDFIIVPLVLVVLNTLTGKFKLKKSTKRIRC